MSNGLADFLEEHFVWEKGRLIPGLEHMKDEWRLDDFGARIRRGDRGKQYSPYGWQIDHIVPTAIGGADTLDNKRPLHCRNNATLGGILGAGLSRGRGLLG
jgi:hypothetical protein